MAVAAIVRQGRVLAATYGTLAILGLLSLYFDRSWVAMVGVVIPLQIALTEWFLGRRLRKHPRRSTGQWILWHQLWILTVGLVVFAILFDWPLGALWEEIPPELKAIVEQAGSLIGMAPLTYLQLLWDATLAVTAGLFALKVAIISWRYGRWIRRLPA